MKKVALFRYFLPAIILFFLGIVIVSAQSNDKLTYKGNKARIAVGTIQSKASECDDEMAGSIGEMLSTALTNNEKFIVLANKEEVDRLKEEIDLGESGMTEEGKSPEKGLMEGADVIITGAVTSFEPEATGKGGALGGLKKGLMGKIGVDSKTAEIGIDLKLIDVRTRRVIKAIPLEAKSTSWGADLEGAGWVQDVAMGGGLETFSNTPMEKAIRSVLADAVGKISKDIPNDYYRYKGKGEYTQEYGKSGSTASDDKNSPAAPTNLRAGDSPSEAQTQAPAAEDMTLYTKYDFIPGDKVIFFDDLAGEEVGEFPSRWNLDNGVFEIAKLGKDTWILCSNKGSIRPKIKEGPLPEKYTFEMDVYDHGPEAGGHWVYIKWYDAEGKDIGVFSIKDHKYTNLAIFENELANKELSFEPQKGIHTMRIMATKSSIKCYYDQERVANVPKVEGFNPVGFRIECDPWEGADKPLLIKSVRYAEGGKTLRQQLDEQGKIITHGILFDPASSKIKAESYKTLADIGQLLTEDPALRISIEGHTDSDGTDDYNMKLSNDRAESVKGYLIANYKIDSARLQSKGWGDSKPIDNNTSPEGKANNRRVELVKL